MLIPILALAWLATSGEPGRDVATQTPDLSLRLSPGDSWKQVLRQSFHEPHADEPDTVFVFERAAVVSAFEGGGYTLETTMRFVQSWEAGVPLPAHKESVPMKRTERVEVSGRVLDAVDPRLDPIEVRLERLARFVAAKTFADPSDAARWTWRHEVTERPGIPAADFTGAVLGRATFAGRDCAKVRIEVREETNSGMAGEGQALVDLATGVTLKWELRVRNALLPGGTGQFFDLRLEINATSLRVKGQELIGTAESARGVLVHAPQQAVPWGSNIQKRVGVAQGPSVGAAVEDASRRGPRARFAPRLQSPAL